MMENYRVLLDLSDYQREPLRPLMPDPTPTVEFERWYDRTVAEMDTLILDMRTVLAAPEHPLPWWARLRRWLS